MKQTDQNKAIEIQAQECLEAEELAWLAGFIARENGLNPIAPEAIIRAYGTTEMPLITQSERGRLWVDRYYIAYEGDKWRIHYAYLTRAHIREESSSYFSASKARKRMIRMPASISNIFYHARREMNANQTNIWFEKPDVVNTARRVHYAYQV